MRIDKVILASDAKRFYLDFWPLVSRVWKHKFRIEPVLALFGDARVQNVCKGSGTVVEMDICPDVPTHLQAQWARYWFPSTEPDTVWITSDIDMLPISRHYFVNMLADIPDDRLVVMNSNDGYYPVCYNVASGRTFQDVFRLPNTFLSSLKCVLNTQGVNGIVHFPEGLRSNEPESCRAGLSMWGVDEAYASLMIRQYSRQERIVRLGRPGGFCGRRLDRAFWHYNAADVQSENYLDCHCLRPYAAHRHELDRLVELILEHRDDAR